MNYAISGQSGFIGQSITKYLIERGENVIGLSRNCSIKELILIFKKANPDYIIHLATYGNHYYQKDFERTVTTNIINTYNLLEAAKTTNYKLFYNISSSSVMLAEQTYYSMTKSCAEKLVELYIRTVNVRPYSIYGPGEPKHKFIPKVIECLSTGKCLVVYEKPIHDWVFISDFIDALFAGRTEIGTGIKTYNKEVIEMLQDISGKKLNYTSGKLRTYDNNNWAAKKGVPSIGIYEGLKRTYEYFTK